MPKREGSMYCGDKKFDREQLVFVVQVILDSALDRIESGSPRYITWEDRVNTLNAACGDPKNFTSYECGALESAAEALAVLHTQLTGKAVTIHDTLAMAGKFDIKCLEFVRSCWKRKGENVRERMKVMRGQKWGPADLYVDYPNCRKAAEKFVDEAFPEGTAG